MITRLRLRNYRSHADSVTELQPVNLFIGPVAAGKSNVFKALTLIQNTIHRSLDELFPLGLGEFQWVRSRWAGQSEGIGFELELDSVHRFPNENARYSLELADGPDGLYVVEETLARRQNDEPWQWVFRRQYHKRGLGEFGNVEAYAPSVLNLVWHQSGEMNYSLPGPQFAKAVAKAVSSLGYYHLEAQALKSLGSGQPWDRIQYNGARLPDFLAWCKFDSNNVHVYEAIRSSMQELLPDLDAIIVTQARSDQQGIAMSFNGQRGYISAPDLSDGTMFSLGLLCLCHSPSPPAILCIEEPETGLHPARLRWLFERLTKLAYPGDNRDPTQVFFSTHSPYLVDFFGDQQECVQLVRRGDGRSTVAVLPTVREDLHLDSCNRNSIGHDWAMGLYDEV